MSEPCGFWSRVDRPLEKEDDMKNEWKDVTEEFTVRLGGNTRSGWVASIEKYTTDESNIRVQLGDLTCTEKSWVANGEDYRFVIVDHRYGTFRIERRVEKPFVFTYTPEFVASLDCKNMSAESVLHHCVLKWDEVIAAHEAGAIGIEASGNTCPACKKYGSTMCEGCPLGGRNPCCGGTYQLYTPNRTVATATAVRDYIQGRLNEVCRLDKAQKAPWVPKQGDPVRAYEQNWCVVGLSGSTYLLFSAEGKGIHGGTDDSFTWGGSVPGCMHHHKWAVLADLTLIEAAK